MRIWLSSCSVRQCRLFDGSDTRLVIVFFACLLFPWTVAKFRMIADPPAGIVGVHVATACPSELIVTEWGARVGFGPWNR